MHNSKTMPADGQGVVLVGSNLQQSGIFRQSKLGENLNTSKIVASAVTRCLDYNGAR